jgi:hypothetical protein
MVTATTPPAADAGNPLAVLERFQKLRAKILQVLDDGARLAERALGSRAHLVRDSFRGARQAVDLSRLNLVVVGGEGQGKSTLLHAVLGDELSPREEAFPGTVAPVYIEWGPGPAPRFEVVLEGDGKQPPRPHPCKDLDEFRQYILQHFNAENKRRVVRGEVRTNTPLLEQGLRLVDLPGVEGVSASISQDSREFIRKQAHAVIGVTRERLGYGALVRLIDTFIPRKATQGKPKDPAEEEVRLHAVVVNLGLEKYLSVQNAEQMKEVVRSWAQASSEHLLRERQIAFDVGRIFVLHLPTAVHLRTGRPEPTTEAVKELVRPELARFDAALGSYMRDNGMIEMINKGTDQASLALGELRDKVRIRYNLLARILNGGPAERAKIVEEFNAAAARATAMWDKVVEPGNLTAITDQHWRKFKPEIDGAKDNVLARLNEVEQEVEGTTERVTAAAAKKIQEDLNRTVTAQSDAIQESVEKALDELLERFCEAASNVLKHLYHEVPILEADFEDLELITPTALLKAKLGSMEESTMDRVAKLGMTYAGAALGFKVGTGASLALLTGTSALAPLVAVPLAVVVGGWLGLNLFSKLRDGQRAAVLKALGQLRNQINGLDTSTNGPIHQEYGKSVRVVADEVGKYLNGQIQSIRHMITLSDAEAAEHLREELEKMGAALKEVADLKKQLDAVVEAI